METTPLNLDDRLPLTCSRKGTCCHGNQVHINAWELASLARERKCSPREFRDLYCEEGGIRLRFDGEKDKKGQQACSQYVSNIGCSVHRGRPLACRLYPLGRKIQSQEIGYIFEGKELPCFKGCPEVSTLPSMSVHEYLLGQATRDYEIAQDLYLELMQNLADNAFLLLLETGLAKTGDTATLKEWKRLGTDSSSVLQKKIGVDWVDGVMLPAIPEQVEDPTSFTHLHNEMIQQKIQEHFEGLATNQEFHEASVLAMGMALYVARAIGANPEQLVTDWIAIAIKHGAKA
jgi:uncharacterized protein